MTHYPTSILHEASASLPFSINIGGVLTELSQPLVMGILNATPDSFYEGSRVQAEEAMVQRVRQIVDEGGAIIDVGACSTRSGALQPSADEEWRRLDQALRVVRRTAPDAVVSVDTYRADIAERCVGEHGVHIINDVSGGAMDSRMFETVARLGVPYVLTHMQGTPSDMQAAPHYGNVTVEVTQWLAERVDALHQMGVADVIVDPGFGFGKTQEHNCRLMKELSHLKRETAAPLLVGVSRKSMVCRALDCTPAEALNGTTVLNTMAIQNGADILRVHDVRAAVEVARLCRAVYF